MNKNIKILIYIVGFVLLIVIAVSGYNYLSERYKSPNYPGLGFENNSQIPVADAKSPKPSEPVNEEKDKELQEDQKPQENQEPQEDQETQEDLLEAPDFTVQDWHGSEVKLSDYIGTPIVLNFWASWCPPCRAEMPHFNNVSEEYAEDELIFLMVDIVDGGRETIDKGKKHVEENGYTFPVLFDTKSSAAITYGVRSLPTTIFIDKDGYIIGGIEGGLDEKGLRYGISLILEE